ncbi:DHA1 family bicyclomycin/chloramphenicol resistance-like MFS transporter [Maritalea mobilis]|uniref:Bcr/CflA family efflux transporter n=1 Tax=Maritalea mobilis TaxID=483324 RepID=A0A4R6VV52_9HYPH|nr:multidrug effflux MFS transporter [Maritalea mobilis]TDQ66626.1 DHA1 family bicyclomycin/chloramphenicol resistance-like MFS transporter [Maritalea mobilis]
MRLKLNPNTNYIEFVLLAATLMALNAVAIDIMLPALPEIAISLGAIGDNQQQLVITYYLIGFGLSQLFYGPLSDAIGRRNTAFIGILIFFVPVALASFVTDFNSLLALRLVQGLGAGASRVIAFAVVRDVFEGKKLAKTMSLIVMVFMAMPIIAPSLGQVLILFLPWQSVFAFMAIMAVIALVWVFLRLPETLSIENTRAFRPKIILEGFRIVFTTPSSLLFGWAQALLLGAIIGFLGTSPQIYLEIYDLGPIYPLMIALTASNLAVASFVNSRLVDRYSVEKVAFAASATFAILGAVWLTFSLTMGVLPLWLLVLLHQPLNFCFGLAGVNQNSLAMMPMKRVAGTAASVLGFISSAGGAVIGAIIGSFYNDTVAPIAAGFMIVGILSCLASLWGAKLKPAMPQPTSVPVK